jgi:hypothetical protein
MNLSWSNLTRMQRSALRNLCQNGPGELPVELGEQLSNLGLVDRLSGGGYGVSAMGLTVPPSGFN